MQTLLIRNIRLAGGQVTNVLIRGGYIASIGGASADNEAEPIDGKDALLLPGLVDSHTHLDKTLWGMGWHKHSAGPSLTDRIENERRIRREVGIDPDRQSGRQVA